MITLGKKKSKEHFDVTRNQGREPPTLGFVDPICLWRKKTFPEEEKQTNHNCKQHCTSQY